MDLTAKKMDFLRLGYREMRLKALTAAYNKKFKTAYTEAAVKSTLMRHKWLCGRPPGFAKGEIFSITPEQERFIRERYREIPLRDVLSELNEQFGLAKKEEQLKAFVHNHGIRSGRTGCFAKGAAPVNKGTKGLIKANSGTFRKGRPSVNIKPLGHERIDPDGYVWIKVPGKNPHTGTEGYYRCKHVVVWEEAHGPVPAGYAVIFRDGVRRHCELANLMLVTRAELLRLNHYRYIEQPDEIKPSVLALAKLEVKAFGLLKNGQSGGKASKTGPEWSEHAPGGRPGAADLPGAGAQSGG